MFVPYEEKVHPVGSGVQKLYRFDNGYGASVVRFMVGSFGGSYGAEDGQWELAVLAFNGEHFKLTYETPITNDVLGRLSEEDVEATLAQIQALPPNPDAFGNAVKRQEESRAALKKFTEEHATR